MTKIQQDAIAGWLSLYLGLPVTARFVDNDDGGWSAFVTRADDDKETEVVCHYPAAQCYEEGGIHVADPESNTATHYYIEVLPGRAPSMTSLKDEKAQDGESVEDFIRDQLKDLGIYESKLEGDFNFEDIGADSLDQVELIMAIEERYNFEISDEEAEKYMTRNLSIVAAAIREKIADRPPTH